MLKIKASAASAITRLKSGFYSKFYPSKNLVLREFELGDASAAKRLNRLSSLASPVSWSEDYNISIDYILRAYAQDNGSFLVGRINGKLVVMGGLQKRDEQTAVLKKLRVHPAFRRRGLAEMLVKEREKIAMTLGYRRVVAETETNNGPMHKLLLKMGYSTDNETLILFGLEMRRFCKELEMPRENDEAVRNGGRIVGETR